MTFLKLKLWVVIIWDLRSLDMAHPAVETLAVTRTFKQHTIQDTNWVKVISAVTILAVKGVSPTVVMQARTLVMRAVTVISAAKTGTAVTDTAAKSRRLLFKMEGMITAMAAIMAVTWKPFPWESIQISKARSKYPFTSTSLSQFTSLSTLTCPNQF